MRYMVIIVITITFLGCSMGKKTQNITIETEDASGVDLIASMSLSELEEKPGGNFILYKIEGESKAKVDFQTDEEKIYWVIDAPVKPGSHTYQLVEGKNVKASEMKAIKEDGRLTIKAGERNLLGYQFETMYPPEGIDSVFKRSAFIHPLWSPHGQVLTRIQPPDHYHHYGIWNPWTHVYFEGDTLDFWNLDGKQGTVRFAGFKSIAEGPVFSEYAALHEHVVFKKDGSEKIALNEIQKIRVYRPEEDYYMVDFTFDYTTASESPFKILEYRYAGFGWRTTEEWNNQNSEVITSAGKDRAGSDGSLAKWFIIQGELGDDYGGAVVMSNPENFNHPEPLRIWPVDMYGRGDMFACFCTTKNTDWLLEPGNTYTLKYRMLVYNGKFNDEKAEQAWKNYASSVQGSLSNN